MEIIAASLKEAVVQLLLKPSLEHREMNNCRSQVRTGHEIYFFHQQWPCQNLLVFWQHIIMEALEIQKALNCDIVLQFSVSSNLLFVF